MIYDRYIFSFHILLNETAVANSNIITQVYWDMQPCPNGHVFRAAIG